MHLKHPVVRAIFRAERIKCTNHAWPDLYGHYREAKFTQTKHHWWWKANRIFDQLAATKDYDGEHYGTRVTVNDALQALPLLGLVVFLEEDHHVAEDFLHVLSLVDAERLSKHQDCDIICLGTYLKNFNFPRTHNAVSMPRMCCATGTTGHCPLRAMLPL